MIYDDYALNPESFEDMAREYQSNRRQVLGLKVKITEVDPNDVKQLFAKLEYLRVLTQSLKNHTSNADAQKVLDDVLVDIVEQTKRLSEILKPVAMIYQTDEVDLKIFCNNLKLAINTTGDIVKLLVKIKDDDESFELSLKLTNSINEFVDINNQLVSLFGECRYRVFGIYKK